MEKEYYCPECNSKLEKIEGCGSISYFCKKCKKLISRKRILDRKNETWYYEYASEFLIHAYAVATMGVPVLFVSADYFEGLRMLLFLT